MTELTLHYIVLASLIGLYGVIWHRRTVWAVLFLAALLPAIYIVSADILGRPKPIEMAWWDKQEIQWFQLVPEEAIYIVVSGPRLYVLPWNVDTAKEIIQQQQGLKPGESLEINRSGSEWNFHPDPPDPLPEKHADTDNP